MTAEERVSILGRWKAVESQNRQKEEMKVRTQRHIVGAETPLTPMLVFEHQLHLLVPKRGKTPLTMLEVEESRSKSNMFLSALPLVESGLP